MSEPTHALRAAEDAEDAADADAAMNEPGESIPWEQVNAELLEDFADARAAREALTEIKAGASPVPAEQVWAELDLDP